MTMFQYRTRRLLSTVTPNFNTLRVRYAPSPTGYLHLGGLRTALFNYLLARKHGGSFVLRIEDTDKTRQQPGAIRAMIDMLHWAGLEYDEGPIPLSSQSSSESNHLHQCSEDIYKQSVDADQILIDESQSFKSLGDFGPYIQSQRLPLYRQAADQLIEEGYAYRCFCSSERLSRLRAEQAKRGVPSLYDRACLGLSKEESDDRVARGDAHTIRLKIPSGQTTVHDHVLGSVSFPHAAIDDQVLLKSDGFPTYHLASVVDDHSMQISHVIRGQEWLSSTPKHAILYQMFGWIQPNWVHLPLLVNVDRTKLSKRHGDVAVEQFRQKGYTKEGLLNFVSLLGWHPGADETKEIFDLADLIGSRESTNLQNDKEVTEGLFSLEGLNKANCVVDRNKLDWINGHHIRRQIAGSQLISGNTNVYDEAILKTIIPKDDIYVKIWDFIVPKLRKTLTSRGHENVSLMECTSQTQLGDIAISLSNDHSMSFATVFATIQAQHERASTWLDFIELLLPFILPPQHDDMAYKTLKTKIWRESTDELLRLLYAEWTNSSSENWTEENAKQALAMVKQTCKSTKPRTSPAQLMLPLRLVLTGSDKGASLGRVFHLLGKERCMKRLKDTCN